MIDPSPVMVNVGGQQELFLVYKTQGNPADGQHATIRMLQLSPSDGVTKVADSQQLLSSSLGSFADTIEAPSMIQHGGAFFLFVAHGNYPAPSRVSSTSRVADRPRTAAVRAMVL